MMLRHDFKITGDMLGNCTSKILKRELGGDQPIDLADLLEDPGSASIRNAVNTLIFQGATSPMPSRGKSLRRKRETESEMQVLHTRKKRFLPLLGAGAFLGLASVGGLATGIYSVIEVQKIKGQQEAIRNHINAIADLSEMITMIW